jgi:hypothetical protein
MPNPAVAIIGGTLASSMIQSQAASDAADAQSFAAQQGIDAQKDAQSKMAALLQPYVGAGNAAMGEAMGLLGLEQYTIPGTPGDTGGPGNILRSIFGMNPQGVGTPASVGYRAGEGGLKKQQESIDALKGSPLFQSLLSQGEEAMLQTASATGGLRGGNTQAAMAQFAPAMLKREIEDRYNKLMGVSQLGQASAAGVGSAGLQTGTNISNLFGNMGAASAANSIAQGKAWGQVASLPMNYLAMQYGAGVKNPSFEGIF